MTQPRMCLPGTTYLVTRTCAERRMLLTPDPTVNQLFAYCVARAALGCDIEVHALSVESNHYHAVVTDHSGDALSAFEHALNRLVACCLKEHYRHLYPERELERIWARRSFISVVLLTPNAVRRAIAYTLTNPVKDGLVPDYRKWPGLNTKPRHWTMAPRIQERPELFFDQACPDWETLPLTLTPPPLLLLGSDLQTVTREVEDLVLSEQRRLTAERAAEHKGYVGVKGVLSVDPFDQPARPRKRSALDPTLAAGGDREVMNLAKKYLKHFRGAYREAYKHFTLGLEAQFPYGTLVMRLRFKALCAPGFQPPWCVVASGP
jgi:putative transposase